MRKWKYSMLILLLSGLFFNAANAETPSARGDGETFGTKIEPDDALKAFVKEYVETVNTSNGDTRAGKFEKLTHPKCLGAAEKSKYENYFKGLLTRCVKIPEPYSLEVRRLSQDDVRHFSNDCTLTVEPTHSIRIGDGAIPGTRGIFAVKEGMKWLLVMDFPTDKELKTYARIEAIEADDSLKAFMKEYVSVVNTLDPQERSAKWKKLIHPKCLAAMESKKYAEFFKSYFKWAIIKWPDGSSKADVPIRDPYELGIIQVDQDYLDLLAKQSVFVVNPVYQIEIDDGNMPSSIRLVYVAKEGEKWILVIEFPYGL